MSKIYRCSCRNSTNDKICKHKTRNPFYINKKPICAFHFSYYKTEYALTIQRYYKGYKIRKILNNVYKKLPCDIQKIIAKYVKEPHSYRKYINTIGNIVEKKIVKEINLINSVINSIDPTNIENMREIYLYFYNNRENINKTMKLYKKYYYTLQNKHNFKYEIIPEFYKNCYCAYWVPVSGFTELRSILNIMFCEIKQSLNPPLFVYSE